MTIGQIQYSTTFTGSSPAAAPAAPAQPPVEGAGDQVHIGQRLAALPRQAVEGVAGAIGGSISAVGHVAPGAVEGLAEGLTTWRGQGSTGVYTATLLSQSIATGVAVGGVLGGPGGMLVGAGVGFMGGLVVRGLEGRANVPQAFVQKVETRVDEAIAQNTEGSKVKIAVQNATQGAILGAGVGAQEGWNIGWEAGKGAVSGVLDVAQGVAEGIYEAIRGHK